MWVLQLLAGALVAPPPPPPPADSVALRREARDAQIRFERLRVHHAPLSWWTSGGRCDEVVGRFCLRFTGEDRNGEAEPWEPPEESREVGEGRERLLETLSRVFEAHPGDAWVAGQLVAYLGEADRWAEAVRASRTCRAARPGWCEALEGFALHGSGESAAAEAAFRRALDRFPAEERREWLDLEWLVELDAYRELRGREGPERERLEARIWALGDPLFLTEANELLVEHLSRHTLARIWEGARNPYGIRWGRDMTQLLVRYGPEVAYERVRDPPAMHMGPPPVVGRFPPGIRGILPELDALLRPTEVGPEAFPSDRRRARSRHGAGPADRVRTLDPQLARFRRGDSLLVVAAWQLPEREAPASEAEVVEDSEANGEDALGASSSGAEPSGGNGAGPHAPPEAALFLLQQGEGVPRRFDVDATGRRGVATGRVPLDAYLLSLEVVDAAHREAWRHRRGVGLSTLHPEVIELSDLLLLEPGGDPVEPGTARAPGDRLERHLERALPGDHFPRGTVEVAWELYGVPGGDGSLRFRLTAERDDRGLLRRAGEALRLLSPPAPVEISWSEGVPADHVRAEPLFRHVEMDLGALDPGIYRLRLTLSLPGRSPTVTERTVEIREP